MTTTGEAVPELERSSHGVTGADLVDPRVAQRRASDPAVSVWVAASAGAGKTKVLTDRVLRLMLAGTPPRRILCITFTKAAAAEMSNRLSATLSDWASLPEGQLGARLFDLTGERPASAMMVKARRLFADVVDCPGGMQILTLHAFAQSILRRFPLEAGLSPGFEVLDERNAAERLYQAQRDVLTAARGDASTDLGRAVATLTADLSEDWFFDLLAKLAQERGRLASCLDRHGGCDGAIAAVRRRLGVGADETVERLTLSACTDGAYDAMALRAACAALATGSKADVERGIAIQSWLDADVTARMAAFDDHRKCFLTADDGSPRKTLCTKPVATRAPGTLEALTAEAERLVVLDERLRSIKVAEATGAMLTVGTALVERYTAIKHARGALDFDDLILAARALLERPGVAPWVLFKLDGGIDHLLIDEAQDTNPDQWSIVRCLSEEFFSGLGQREPRRTLFVVGDGKQSIFSFQRADPAEFWRMRAHFTKACEAIGDPLRVVDLDVSFRSVSAVLRCVDAVFASEAVCEGVLAPGERMRHRAFRRLHGGRVELWPVAPREDVPEPEPWSLPVEPIGAAAADTRLAHVLAARIAGWIGDGERLSARGRALRASDILVLVRRRTGFVTELVRALKTRAVPVAGVDRMTLTSQLPVQDVLAVAQLLLLPTDDLTLAVVLKGPFVGLGEDALMDLAVQRVGSLWSALRDAAVRDAAVREDAGGLLRATVAWLDRLLARVDYVAPYELLTELASAECPADPNGSGRRALLRRLGPEAEDPLDELLTAALMFETQNAPSLQTFLHWLQAGEAELKRELEQAGGAVRIMTVHGAKGLQAPVVIVPDSPSPRPPEPLILWPEEPSSGPGGVPLWAPSKLGRQALCAEARALKERREAEERRRLLYVALTRAEDRLIVCGWEGARRAPPDGWHTLTEQAMDRLATEESLAIRAAFDFRPLSPMGWGGDGWVYEEPQVISPEDRSVAHARSDGGIPEPLPLWAVSKPAAEPSPPRPLVPSAPLVAEPAARSPMQDDDGWRFRRGLLIHRLLQSLPDIVPARRHAAARAFLSAPAHGLTPETRDALAAEVLAVLDHPDFAHVFGPESLAEVPVAGLVGGMALSGQIDRLAVRDDGVWIIDFKSNRPPPRLVADVAPAYLSQLAAYRSAIACIWPGRPVRCALLWTDGPSLMEIDASILDAHAPSAPAVVPHHHPER